MTETPNTVETGKPTPKSLQEIHLMDRKERRGYRSGMTKAEKKQFDAAVIMAYDKLPRTTKQEWAKMLVDKLSQRENKGIGDKVELWHAKAYLKHISLPERPPIFLRKLRTKEFPWPKWIKEAKSPYLIASTS